MAAGFFEIGRMPVIGACSKPGSIVMNDSADEWVCTTVACPFQFYRTSQTTPINQDIVKNIAMRLRAQTPGSSPDSPPTDAHDVPADISYTPPPPFFPASDLNGASPNPAGQVVAQPQLIPHPLNPSITVHVRSTRAYGPALRPPSIKGRAIPIR